jgi:KRAB domain-containing zinc finger protein
METNRLRHYTWLRQAARGLQQGWHSGAKPFLCGECDKAFLRGSDLRTHERTHSGLRPFVCGECDKRFSHAGSVRRHKRIHIRA